MTSAPQALSRLSPEDFRRLYERHKLYLQTAAGGQRLAASHTYLRRAVLRGLDLRSTEFVGSDFSFAVCQKVNFAEANLFAANFESADLSGSILARADLRGTVLRNANLEKADLSGVDFREGYIMVRDQRTDRYVAQAPERQSLASVDISGANFKGANLAGARMGRVVADRAILTNANFRNAKLIAANFTNADLRGAVFTGADLTDTDFTNSSLQGAVLTGANMVGTVFDGADLTAAHVQPGEMMKASLKKTTLPRPPNRTQIEDVLARHQQWITSLGKKGAQACFARMNLRGFTLVDADVSACDFTMAVLVTADMRRSRLDMALFPDVIAANINLESASLRGAKFECANLTNAQLTGVTATPFPLVESALAEWPSNFRRAKLDNALMRAGAFDKALFDDAYMSGVDLRAASCRGTSFRGACLRNAKLRGADLTGADFTGADIAGADLTPADLPGAQIGSGFTIDAD